MSIERTELPQDNPKNKSVAPEFAQALEPIVERVRVAIQQNNGLAVLAINANSHDQGKTHISSRIAQQCYGSVANVVASVPNSSLLMSHAGSKINEYQAGTIQRLLIILDADYCPVGSREIQDSARQRFNGALQYISRDALTQVDVWVAIEREDDPTELVADVVVANPFAQPKPR